MNNYIRYYDRDNSETPQRPWHSNVFNHQEASSSHDLLPEVLEPEPEVHKDEKNRRVISKDALYEDPVLFYNVYYQESSQTPVYPDNSWTQQNWLRAGESTYESIKGPRRQPMSKLQKKLTAAMAQPVQMSKAESMMQKMGWQGGALGRTGHGIVEPITPNAVYATKTLGFGNIAPPPHRTNTKPQQKEKKIPGLKKLKTEHFNTTALLHILEFVKNDKEIEIVFDPKLYKYERKAIHKLVNEVINGDDMAGMNFDSVAQMDVVTDIHKYNNYVLCTQSEGEEPNRKLCVYKEAPEHVYLVTPSDLNDDIPDEDISDDKDDKTNAAKDKNDTVSQNKVQENDVKNKYEVKKELNDTKNKATDKNEEKELDDESKNKPNNMEVDEEENPFLRSITRNLRNAHETEVTSTEPKDTIDTPNQTQTNDCSIDNPNECQTSKEKTAIEKIIDYFIEFSADEVYSEFRFLGPFDSEEIDRINEFINNLHACICSGKCDDDKYENVLKCIAKDEFVFEIREDCNGSPVIYKCKQESR